MESQGIGIFGRGVATSSMRPNTPASGIAPTLDRNSTSIPTTVGSVIRVADEWRTTIDERARVAYLTVLYPATSHTFIHREVEGLRARGVSVRTFSINDSRRIEVLSDFERSELEHTRQIKGLGAARLARTILSTALRHPAATISTMRQAMRSRGLDVGARIKSIFQVGEALVLFDACQREQISHVHAHFGQAPANIAWYATHFARQLGHSEWAFSFTIHGPQDCLAEGDATLRRKLEAVEQVISVSDYTAAQLVRRIDPELWPKVSVVRCGVDVSAADVPDKSERDPQTILMVARLSPEKGHVIAVEALARLRARGVDATLRVVGPGDPESTLMPAAREHGVDDAIDLIGPLEPADVADEFRRATVFALPSFAEGLPIVIMESMANGCPVVASGISGIPELIDHGVSGMLVPPARADKLADALEALLTDDALRSSMAAAARTSVQEMHDGDRQVDALLATFEAAGALGQASS